MSREAHGVIRKYLHGVLRGRWGAVDQEDLVDEAIVRFVAKCSAGSIDANDNPGSYLSMIAYNLGVDSATRAPTEVSTDFAEIDVIDDSASDLIEKIEDQSLLVPLMRQLRTSGNTNAQRVLLELTNSTNADATTVRSLGERLEMSKSTVQRSLDSIKCAASTILGQAA